jgi:hypothetical protein
MNGKHTACRHLQFRKFHKDRNALALLIHREIFVHSTALFRDKRGTAALVSRTKELNNILVAAELQNLVFYHLENFSHQRRNTYYYSTVYFGFIGSLPQQTGHIT